MVATAFDISDPSRIRFPVTFAGTYGAYLIAFLLNALYVSAIKIR